MVKKEKPHLTPPMTKNAIRTSVISTKAEKSHSLNDRNAAPHLRHFDWSGEISHSYGT